MTSDDIEIGNIITTSEAGNGGNIQAVSTIGSINSKNIATYSINANAGKVTLKAGNEITVGEINAFAKGGGGKGGEVKLNAIQDISTKLIFSSSETGDAGNISLTSVKGEINTNEGLISATSVSGNAGKITLKSAKDITVGDIFARAAAAGGVFNGGIVTLNASDGKVKTGNITTISYTGDAGNIKLVAAEDIETGALASNVVAGLGKGGNISLTGNNIIAESLRADSFGAEGGEIKLYASKFIQVTGSTLINGNEYSIFTGKQNDLTENEGVINIKHGGGISHTVLSVGDSSVNGFQKAISSSKAGIFPLESPIRFLEDFSLGDIKINTENEIFPADIPKVISSSSSLFSGIDYDFKYISNPDPTRSDVFLPDSFLLPNTNHNSLEWTTPSFLLAVNPVLTTVITTLTIPSRTSPEKVREYQTLGKFDALAASGALFMKLVDKGTIRYFPTSKGYPGIGGTLIGGGNVNWRPVSGSGQPTIDIYNHNTPGVDPLTGKPYSLITEIKFVYPDKDQDSEQVPDPKTNPPSTPENDFKPFIPYFPGLRLPDPSIWNGL